MIASYWVAPFSELLVIIFSMCVNAIIIYYDIMIILAQKVDDFRLMTICVGLPCSAHVSTHHILGLLITSKQCKSSHEFGKENPSTSQSFHLIDSHTHTNQNTSNNSSIHSYHPNLNRETGHIHIHHQIIQTDEGSSPCPYHPWIILSFEAWCIIMTKSETRNSPCFPIHLIPWWTPIYNSYILIHSSSSIPLKPGDESWRFAIDLC